MAQSSTYVLTVGGQKLDQALQFGCNSLLIDNPTNQYIWLSQANRFVPPNTHGMVVAMSGGQALQAEFLSPVGIAPAIIIPGQFATLEAHQERLPLASGSLQPLGSQSQQQFLGRITIPANGVASIVPFTLPAGTHDLSFHGKFGYNNVFPTPPYAVSIGASFAAAGVGQSFNVLPSAGSIHNILPIPTYNEDCIINVSGYSDGVNWVTGIVDVFAVLDVQALYIYPAYSTVFPVVFADNALGTSNQNPFITKEGATQIATWAAVSPGIILPAFNGHRYAIYAGGFTLDTQNAGTSCGLETINGGKDIIRVGEAQALAEVVPIDLGGLTLPNNTAIRFYAEGAGPPVMRGWLAYTDVVV